MESLSDVPVRAVILDGEGNNSGLLEGAVTLADAGLRFSFGDASLDCPYRTIERVTVGSLPGALADRREHGAVIQWLSESGRHRAILATESDGPAAVLSSVCAAVLDGTNAIVEQTITPNKVDAERDPETRTAETELTVDSDTGVVTFAEDGLRAVRPEVTTVNKRVTFEIDGTDRPVFHTNVLTPEETVVTRIIFPSDRPADVLRDHVDNRHELTGRGGPIRVLFVDDEPELAEVINLYINDRHDDITVRFASNTPFALDLIEANSFECIVTDYVMPEGGAPVVLDAARDQSPSIPCIVFSRIDPDSLTEEERPTGHRAWIMKEMGTDQYDRIAETVKRLVALRRAEMSS